MLPECRGGWFAGLAQEAASRAMAHALMRGGPVLMHPVTHLVVIGGVLFYAEKNKSSDLSRAIRDEGKELRGLIGTDPVKLLCMGALNGVLFGGTVGLYWRSNPINQASGGFVQFLVKLRNYGVVPVAACAS